MHRVRLAQYRGPRHSYIHTTMASRALDVTRALANGVKRMRVEVIQGKGHENCVHDDQPYDQNDIEVMNIFARWVKHCNPML
jgi:hypothetical protein